MKNIDFYKELAILLDKYRPIVDEIDYRRDDEDWIQLRVPYAFMLGDTNFSYEMYRFTCNKCGVSDYTNELLDNDACGCCFKGKMEQVELNKSDINDWINHQK